MQEQNKYISEETLLNYGGAFINHRLFTYNNEFYAEIAISLDPEERKILYDIYSNTSEDEKCIETILLNMISKNSTIRENILSKWRSEINAIQTLAQDFKVKNIFHSFIKFHSENPEGPLLLKNISWQNQSEPSLTEAIQIITTLNDEKAWESFILEFQHKMYMQMIHTEAEFSKSKKIKDITEMNKNFIKIEYLSYQRLLKEAKVFFTVLYPRLINLKRYRLLAAIHFYPSNTDWNKFPL